MQLFRGDFLIYLYDGSFAGFLTSVYHAVSDKDKFPEIYPGDRYTELTFFEISNINTDNTKADMLLDYLEKKISKLFVYELFLLYLSDVSSVGTLTVQYIRDGLKHGKNIHNYLHLTSANEVMRLKRKVLHENHRLKGLLRFKKYDNLSIADISPDHNVLPILYRHFERRLPNENWIIRDKKRKVAVIHFDNKTDIAKYEDTDGLPVNNDNYEKIWCAFYKSIAIKERMNLRQRLNYMPKRYWQNIIEMQDAIN